MPTKYKAGDKVVVRTDLEHKRYYMEHDKNIVDSALGSMIRLAGKTVTIKRVECQKYIIEELRGFYWTDGMFAGFPIREEKIYRDDEDETVISYPETVDLLSLYKGK